MVVKQKSQDLNPGMEKVNEQNALYIFTHYKLRFSINWLSLQELKKLTSHSSFWRRGRYGGIKLWPNEKGLQEKKANLG